MLNRNTLAALLLLISVPGTLVGQVSSDSIGYIPRKNLAKIGITSGLFSVLSLNYERVLNPDLSVAMTASFMIPSTPTSLFNLNTEELEISSDRTLAGYYFTPEVKWFVESSDPRPAPRGLYVGAYLRYSDTWFEAMASATGSGTDASGSVNADLRIDLFEYGIGPSVGYQWLAFKDRLVFDAIFFAPRFSVYTLKVKADLNGEGALADDLSQALEELIGRDVVPVSIDVSSTGTSTSNSNSFGYRFGIKVGYAF